MSEETSVVEEEIVTGTPEAGSETAKVLEGSGDTASNVTPEGSTAKETVPAAFNPDEEVDFQVGDKTFTRKVGDLIKLLENEQALTEREKAILKAKESQDRDYTQKSQANAQFRKALESTFERMPEQNELKALGQLWKSYFSNPQARQAIDGILSGQISVDSQKSGESKRDPYVLQLEQKIFDLEERLGGFTTSIEEREQQARVQEAQKTFGTWAKSKEAQGIKITEEIDKAMAPFVAALKQANPDATPESILDLAYKHATIDQTKSTAANDVLVSADKAKKQGIIRVTPKGGSKPDAQMGYKDIVLSSAH